MITSVTEQDAMKKQKPSNLEAIPPVDEAEFTEVIRKMVNTSPVTREDVEDLSKLRRRKKNPETDPAKLAMLFPAMPTQSKKR
jgi:hypothetical protein